MVKRNAGKIARYFLSRVVAIVICWLPSLFPGDQVVPKSDPPSTTFGIYPHRTTPGSPSPSTSIRCKRVAKSQPSQWEAVRCASQSDVLYVSRPDPSSTTEHRYTTSHHTKIIRLPPSIVRFGGGKFQTSLRQSASRSGCTDRIHTTPGSPPSSSMMIKGTMAGHSGLPRVNGCARCCRFPVGRIP